MEKIEVTQEQEDALKSLVIRWFNYGIFLGIWIGSGLTYVALIN